MSRKDAKKIAKDMEKLHLEIYLLPTRCSLQLLELDFDAAIGTVMRLEERSRDIYLSVR